MVTTFGARRREFVLLRIFELLLVSAVMQMGLALPMAYYFHRATTIGLPANIAVVPLTGTTDASCSTLGRFRIYLAALAKIPALITALALQAITGTVRGLGSLRLADLRVATPSFVMIAAASLASDSGNDSRASSRMARRRRTARPVSGILNSRLRSTAPANSRRNLRGHFHRRRRRRFHSAGDAARRTLLIDAGGPVWGAGTQLDFGEDVVSPYLWTRRISRLDVVAISHGHSDHIGGMPAMLKDFRPKELWIGLLPPSRALDHLIAEAQALGIKVVRHWEGDDFDFGGAKVRFLFRRVIGQSASSPKITTRWFCTSARISSSEVPAAPARRRRAKRPVERRIATLHPLTCRSFKSGPPWQRHIHHARNSGCARKPTFAVISVGFHTSFWFAPDRCSRKSRKIGIHVYRTDVDGAMTFYLDGHAVNAITPSANQELCRRFEDEPPCRDAASSRAVTIQK